MSTSFDDFLDQQILTRKGLIEERNVIYDWPLNENIPGFIHEKVEEIKLMITLGLDNYSIKSLILLLEEIMFHILVGAEIQYEDQYLEIFGNIEKDRGLKYGWQVLKRLKERNLIHPDDHLFCSRFFNDESNGGERIRNIEIHNLISEKMEGFSFRQEVQVEIGEEGNEILTKMVKQKPQFVHLSARDMVSRDIIVHLAGLFNMLNRNAEILSRFNNLPNKESHEIIQGLPIAKVFFCIVRYLDASILTTIKEDILKLGDVNDMQIREISSDATGTVSQIIFLTNTEHTSVEVMQALHYVKSTDQYELGEIGIKQ